MQPYNNDQCPSQGDSDGRRNAEQSTFENETWLALEQIYNENYRPVRVAEPGKPFNLSAGLTGKGGAAG